ncbi:bifunctional glutamate N-acetyltransferase/amino-acid acetyltransferase ArgJ [Fictibacillus terranigra]|uniref:Arginine biosynthesis bifunctional protein ArgJ n=1 Tax=Fictibacillus terranigra TaxID=3058424 RepID=A0ABT8E761_9BACL|nr:bifunctional glutamate N-acetyltransferase/amino-acid acetyltransferase ArgJ [Fictibacillus sp. CENA-BCM004]MDN4073719.1 bifunctional glutamate N-acetyltransferase/amino-acid acetyltransferase ArgJ [Fictibacillus sp. CENA-BCM004]
MASIISSQLKKITGSNITLPKGFTAAGINCGIKFKKKDLGIILSEKPASAAAVYTTSKIKAAPLEVTKESIETEGLLQAVIVNSGNANAFTGEQGRMHAYAMCREVSERFGLLDHHVGVASTGIIGETMPIEKILQGIQQLTPAAQVDRAMEFSQSILTTDTKTKNACYSFNIGESEVILAGTAKGSGMIHPNMATMLSFLTTDANISSEHLHLALKKVTDQSFNCITVDGETSTNDMVLILANGLAGHEELSPEHPDWGTFLQALTLTCTELAKSIARDGEGATKLIEVTVEGAATGDEARAAAKSIVGSPLVKSAIFGCDPNWGRIVAVLGYAGVEICPDSIDLSIGNFPVLRQSKIEDFNHDEISDYLTGSEISITVNLHKGNGKGKAWGCDLTYDYVQINSSYTT